MNLNDAENRLKDIEAEMANLDAEAIDLSLKREQSLRKAIEAAIPSGIAVVDDIGTQVYVNPSFCKLVGWKEQELIGNQPPYLYWAKQDIANINRAFELTLKNQVPQSGFELLFQHKSGALIPVRMFIRPFIQEDNRTFWLANVIDNTEQKHKEAALKRSEMLLSSTLESLRDTIIFSIDKNYKYLLFNKAHIDAMKFAYNSNIKPGISMLDCVTIDENRTLLKENFDLAFKGESVSLIQTFGDIHIDYFELFIDPIHNENNDIVGCTILARNITERKRMELELKESETKFREIINQIHDGIIVFDEEGKIFVWNKGSEKISGIYSEDVINKNVIDVRYQSAPPETRDKNAIENTLKEIIAQNNRDEYNRISDYEIVSLMPPYRKHVQSNTFPIHLAGHNLFCAVIRDVTETKRYEKELIRITEDKDKFYSALAQYLYTPFSTFHNFTKVMTVEIDTLPIKEIQKMAVMMSKSASNFYNLLDNLLQWTKMNQGKITYSPEKLNIRSTSQEALSILKSNAQVKNIIVSLADMEDLAVFADLFMVKSILRNLVSHMIKSIHKDGKIDISARQTPPDITVSVYNNGPSLSADEISSLLSTSEINTVITTAEEKGTALGLILCREFIEKHGGRIWVESKGLKGTYIHFTLPGS